MSAPVFEIYNLKVAYGSKTAVEGLNLQLMPGQSLGLLGANGAGKTSTLRALLGMVRPRAGVVSLFGSPKATSRVLARLGYAPEDGLPPDFLSAQEYLAYVAAFRVPERARRKAAVHDLLEVFELAPEKKIRDYSKGMKRRLLLAQAMLGQPELLVLDEPLNGLDPLVIIKLRNRVEAFRASGGSILFSSHILNEVEKSCTHVAIMSKGRLLSYSKVEELVQEFGSVEAAFAKKVGDAEGVVS